jgi:hypothetical protein
MRASVRVSTREEMINETSREPINKGLITLMTSTCAPLGQPLKPQPFYASLVF